MGVFMLAVLFTLVCNCHGVNPGFRTTITGKGLDYGECFEFILYSYKSNLYHIETVNVTQFCVNYSVHHASFVQTIILQFLHNRSQEKGLLE